MVKSEHDYRATSLGIPTYLVTRSIDATSAVDEVIMTENSAKTKTFDAVVDNPELQATIDN